MNEHRDPWLLTPGPLTTSQSTKMAMNHDWGSRDVDFIEMNRQVRSRLLRLVNAQETHVCVCMQGSGTFAIEAALGTLLSPHDSRLLVLVNGAYGHRMVKISQILGRNHCYLEWPEGQTPQPEKVEQILSENKDITHVAVVHCETTTGILNPIEPIAQVVSKHQRRLIIDSMSGFGALELDASAIEFDAVVASTNKCLEGVPGMGFVLVNKNSLVESKGNAHSLALDLYEQWAYTEKSGQWRFTPPTHVIAAFHHALGEHQKEGGVAGRFNRYSANCRRLVSGMRALGFETFLPDEIQAPIIVTFKSPVDANFDFEKFYTLLRDAGYVIYPGKLTQENTFRIGCIGQLSEDEISGALTAIQQNLKVMGVSDCRPG